MCLPGSVLVYLQSGWGCIVHLFLAASTDGGVQQLAKFNVNRDTRKCISRFKTISLAAQTCSDLLLRLFFQLLRWNAGAWGRWRPFQKCSRSITEIKWCFYYEMVRWQQIAQAAITIFTLCLTILFYTVSVCVCLSVHVWHLALAWCFWSVICSLVWMNLTASRAHSVSPCLSNLPSSKRCCSSANMKHDVKHNEWRVHKGRRCRIRSKEKTFE